MSGRVDRAAETGAVGEEVLPAAAVLGPRSMRKAAGLGARITGMSWYSRALIALTLVALAARTVWLGSLPRFWGDEAFTGVAVRHSWMGMLDVVRHDNHPPLEYLLVKAVGLVSTAPGALRLVPALAGVAAIPVAAALGRRVGGDWAGLLAAGAVAAFPQFVLAGRDARMYSLATTLVLLAALALWRAIDRPSPRRLALYALCVALAVYTHYFAVLAITGQLLAALIVFRPSLRVSARLVLACAAGGLTLVPWLLVALPQFQHAGDAFWLPKVTLETVVPNLPATLALPPAERNTVFSQWLGALAGAVLLLALLTRRGPDRTGAAYLLAAAAVPTFALVLVSFYKPLYDPRFAAIFWASGMVVLGASLTVFRWRWVGAAAIAMLAAVALVTLLQVRNPDYEALMAPVAGNLHDDDVVALNGPGHYFSIAYELGPDSYSRIRVVAGTIPWFFGVAGYAPGTHVSQVPDTSGRIFLVTDTSQADPALPAGFHRVARSCQDYACLDTYSR